MVGKLLARIVKERLQAVAERFSPESQCGSRKHRGCVDMIFVARQLMEKAREHDDSLYMSCRGSPKGTEFHIQVCSVESLGEVWHPPRLLSECEYLP